MEKAPFRKIKKIHFIGIGGIGMSAIAKIVHSMGFAVSGSDERESEITTELRTQNMSVYIGHHKKHLETENVEVVVTSTAISKANPELIAAQEKNIPVIRRGEMLAELMRLKFGIAIAGTHGKTTTTSLATALLHEANISPTSLIGGKWFGINSNAHLGKSQYFVCEADESDGSFLKLSPVISLVTNIDFDHMEYYKNKENLFLAFLEFINKTPFYGKSILCLDSKPIVDLVDEVTKPYITYGIENTDADIVASNVKCETSYKMTYDVHVCGKNWGRFELSLLGSHNVLNSLAVVGLASELSIDKDVVKQAFKNFKGIDRRMSLLGKWKNFDVRDDYGHHPTEIKVTLQAMKKAMANLVDNCLVCIFQPHRYSRTLEHYAAFAESFSDADQIYLAEIYPAGEEPIPNVSTKLIYDKMDKKKDNRKIYYYSNREDLLANLQKNNVDKKGTILTIGAGDIYKLAKQLVQSHKMNR